MSNSHYVIPGRCEVIRYFRLGNTDPEDAVIDKQEIFQGVFVASSIINPNNCLLRILNTHSRAVEVKKILRLKTEKLSNFLIINNNRNDGKNKQEKLLEILGKSLPNRAPPSLKKLCSDFSDYIFLLS